MVCSMAETNSILIKNIFIMLSYAFQVLQEENYKKVAAEEFQNMEDLLAAILAKGVAQQVKRGLYREYQEQEDSLPVLRGKLELNGTFRHQWQQRRLLSCQYDELTQNNLYNQVIKTTLWALARSEEVKRERRSALKKLLVFFQEVGTVQPEQIPWRMLRFHRGNRTYEMLLNLCYLTWEGLLQTTEQGDRKLSLFSDEHMARLYEKFLLAYYCQHHPELDEVKSAQISWHLDAQPEEDSLALLPAMQSDVFLRRGEKTLIIDAKFYSSTLQTNYGKKTLHSQNLYQIYAYVKNQDRGHTGKVSGLLLYAKTQEALTPDCRYDIDGNIIAAKTLDLNQEFSSIARQLDEAVEEYIG